MINYKIVYRIMSMLLFIEAVMMLLSTGVSLCYELGAEGDLHSLFLSTVVTASVAIALAIAGRNAKKNLRKRESFLLVSLAWIFWSTFGMLPYLIDGHIPNITDAFFETMSGFSTTGATILNDIEAMPHGLLFWRSLTQWIGGLGIVFFTIAILPIFGIGGVQLFAAEAAGPTTDKLFPRIGVTARWIWGVYLSLTLLEVVFLMFGGMSLYDAVCHAFTTTSTGGFSPKQDSIAAYNSPYIEYVIATFMTISGINFMLLFYAVSGKASKFFADNELQWFLRSMLIFVGIITLVLVFREGMGIEEAFRASFFQVSSLHTTCGYATADFMLWPPITWACLSIVMITGACAGSTTGGIKSIRMVSMWRIMRNHIKHIIHPNAVLPVRVNGQMIQPTLVIRIFAFAFAYMGIIIITSVLLMAFDMGFIESLGCTISAMGGVGPGLGKYGPAATWYDMPAACKWILSFVMLLGRLEMFTVLVLFTPRFWKQHGYN